MYAIIKWDIQFKNIFIGGYTKRKHQFIVHKKGKSIPLTGLGGP
jgi:hypothetical protein